MGDRLLPKLNIVGKPIAHKYREGKMKSILKRKEKSFEIVGKEALCSKQLRHYILELGMSEACKG